VVDEKKGVDEVMKLGERGGLLGQDELLEGRFYGEERKLRGLVSWMFWKCG